MSARITKLCLGGTAALVVAIVANCGGSERTRRTPNPRATLTFPSGTKAPVKSDKNGVVTANLVPSTTETQTVTASEGSAVKDVVVAFPPGSLSVATEISVAEAPKVESTTLVSELGLGEGSTVAASGTPVMVSSSSAIDLAEPMIISLAIPSGTSLVDGDLLARMGVVYRVSVQATGQRLVGVVPAEDLTIENGRLLYATKYFGWFQVTIFDKEVDKVERESSLPLYTSLSMVFEGDSLPSCGKADLGRTIYVIAEKVFKYCAEAGWTNIDLAGPAGAAGAAGANGAAGAQGPTGAQGPSGDDGIPGNNGTNGTNGSNGQSMSLYKSDGTRIGFLLGFTGTASPVVAIGTTAAANVGVFAVSPSGDYEAGLCATSGTCACFYSSGSCTGSCLSYYRPAKNSVFSTVSSGYMRAVGNESTTTPASLYQYSGGSCNYYSSGVSVYPVTNAYTYPAGTPQPPFGTGIYVDF